MRISKVTPLTMGTEWRNITFVKVETDEGLVGIADSRILNRTEAVIGYLKEAVPLFIIGTLVLYILDAANLLGAIQRGFAPIARCSRASSRKRSAGPRRSSTSCGPPRTRWSWAVSASPRATG